MYLVDANVLLHTVNKSAREHRVARRWLHEAFDGTQPVGFAWTVLLAFLRLGTHPSVFPRPLGIEQATGITQSWLDEPAAVLVEPSRRHLSVLRGLLADAGTAGNLVSDAHLATLALEHGAVLVSFDRDFERFSGLRRLRPG